MNPHNPLQLLMALLLVPLAFLAVQLASHAQCAETTPSSTTQYILVNRAPGQGMYQGVPETLGRKQFEEVLARFPNRGDARIQTGLSYVFSCFRTPPETTVAALKVFLETAAETDTPVLVQIDTEHWWEARPDLWNWWDPAQPGYDPANRENVEWTGWSPDNAIKIAWRNWGQQIRVLPPPNLASTRYTAACRAEIRRLVPVVMNWHARLPQNKKHLLIGIKLGHETSIGINAFHYPSGNDLLAKPVSDDPVRPLDTEDVLARGVAQIGYAALTSSGIRTRGVPTESELRDVAQRYLQMLCREAAQAGVPRERLFTHGAGWKEGELTYDVPVNHYACPGWSFYQHAADPRKDLGVQRNLAKSDAPYWAATEWLLQGTGETAAWRDALTNTLSDPRCRYVCIFNWESIRSSESAQKGITELVEASAGEMERSPKESEQHASLEEANSTPPNLIFNGDFEQAAAISPPPGWSMWGEQQFKAAANYSPDTANPHGGTACLRIHCPANTAGYLVTDPTRAIRPKPGFSYKVQFWARADRQRKALFGITAYETVAPFKDAPGPGFFPLEVDATWRQFAFEVSEGFDFFSDRSRYLLLTFKATTDNKEAATLFVDDVTATEAISAKPKLLDESALKYPPLPHPLLPGDSLSLVIDAGSQVRPAVREVGGISFHRVRGWTGHPYDRQGKYTLPVGIESAIRDLHLPMTRFYGVGDEPFDVEVSVDKAAEMCRRAGIPEAWTPLELETQSASTKLTPEIWERAVRHAKEKQYGFRYWEIGNEPYSSVWGEGGAFPTPETYIEHVKEVTAAIRRADTNAQVGVGIHGDNVKWGNYVLQQTAGCYDFVVAHHYAFARVFDEPFEDVVLTRNEKILDGILRLNALIEAYNPGREIYQLDTEWGVHASGPHGQRADYVDRNANIIGTLHRAVRLICYAREGMLRGASSWQMLSDPNGQGFGILFPKVPEGRTMLYWLYYYFNRHVGQSVVEMSGTAPYYTPPRADQHDLATPLTPALVTLSEDGEKLYLIVVNGSWTRSVQFQAELRNFRPGDTNGVLLSNDDLDAKPLLERKEDFVHTFTFTADGNKLTGIIPPHSVVMATVTRLEP